MAISDDFSVSRSDETIYSSACDPVISAEAFHTYLITKGQRRHFVWDWDFVRGRYPLFSRRTTSRGEYTTTRIGPARYIKRNN